MHSPKRHKSPSSVEDDLLFMSVDVSPLEFWEQRVAEELPEGLTGHKCYNTTIAYCSLATRRGSTWKGKLKAEHGIDNYTLHYTAILQLFGSSRQKRLGFHMLETASDLGYGPSTMVIYRMLLQTKDLNNGPQAKLFKVIEPRFRQLLQGSGGRDLNALTLQGMMLRRIGDDDKALQFFDQALVYGEAEASLNSSPETAATSAGQKRLPRWDLEASCHLGRGRILLKENILKPAEAAFRVAAFELDNEMACLELAKMLPVNSPERMECILKVGQTGDPRTCFLLAQTEANRILEIVGVKRFMPFSRFLQLRRQVKHAAEWLRVAGQPEMAADLLRGRSKDPPAKQD
ncbi:hypothetical protein B0T26DRAFT_641055 [Lasiosphaeria miniovina]|uniref:Uncharacterized protein n=1 Tax=Lasiosphaeria miniovina TaxID=1954250 RepID=A0AA40AUZ8_9PEZI|nr:uncharacterized protein B0T26DRAFT_641055 [Lasiosphaeria miniovina]KAK0722515.1 hypothetical protein B0T26DRAFT_641055 [Lasiosphaeria miniovina]